MKFNYKKIQDRIDKLNSLRDCRDHFTGTWKQLDRMMDLSLYNRQDLGHALCLDFKTDVTVKVTKFKQDNVQFGIKHYFLVVDGNPCTFELIDKEDLSGMHTYIKAIGLVKSLYNDLERKYEVVCKDHGGCGCWFIKAVKQAA